MFLIRQSRPEDVSPLVKLARTVYFINLPPNEQLVGAKIEHSAGCFRSLAGKASPQKKSAKSKHNNGAYGHSSDLFMFSMIDVESGGVIGTSQLIAKMGGPGDPNWAMKVTEKHFHSESLRFGTTHTVGQLYGDESGPTEVGGLILDPGFRGHKLRPGRFLSFVRFHFMALHRNKFAERVLAEMMAPVSSEGDNPFWDAFGRKFIPVKYAEADRFCQHNRKFIYELLPKEEIYLTLLPLEVINTVAVVSKETLPARRMLESLGFEYRGFIDPFDGGPHLDAKTDAIPLVKNTRLAHARESTDAARCTVAAIISTTDDEGNFRAVEAWIEPAKGEEVVVDPAAMDVLELRDGATIGLTILGKFGPTKDDSSAKPKARQSRTAKPIGKVAKTKPKARSSR